jgi:exopolysaccharide production protein ExoZ
MASLKSLQAARAIAVVGVVAYHLSITLGNTRYLGEAIFQSLTWRGNLGVDLFFVLSGFIIAFAHERDINDPGRLPRYAWRRLVRIYPIYWLYIGVLAALLATGLGREAKLPESINAWVLTVFLVRVDESYPLIQPAWTLVHELCFYLLFSTFIISKKLGISVFALWFAIILIRYESPAHGGGSTPIGTYFSLYNLDFVFGMAAYMLWKRSTEISSILSLFFGSVLLAVSVGVESGGVGGAWLCIAYGIAFGLMLLGLAGVERHFNLRIPTLLLLVGDASYTIYLTHEASMGLFLKIALKTGDYIHVPAGIIFAFGLVAPILAGVVAFRFLEQPLLNVLRSRQATPQAQSVALGPDVL